ncbi:unnamed protein product, partial [Pleuronectes platessa]
ILATWLNVSGLAAGGRVGACSGEVPVRGPHPGSIGVGGPPRSLAALYPCLGARSADSLSCDARATKRRSRTGGESYAL